MQYTALYVGVIHNVIVERLKNVPVATLIEDPNSGRGESEGGMLQFIYTHNESEASVWPDGVPQDGSPLEELKHPLFTLVVICYMLSGAVILWAMVCIVFNICFRNKKWARKFKTWRKSGLWETLHMHETFRYAHAVIVSDIWTACSK